MKLYLIILLLGCLAFSCTDKNKPPADVLDRDKMETVLWDVIRAGEYLNSYNVSADTSVDKVAESLKWYEKVYTLHHISKEDFTRSYEWYKAHPALMKEVLDSLATRKVYTPPVPAVPDTAAAKTDTPIVKKPRLPADTLRKRLIQPVTIK